MCQKIVKIDLSKSSERDCMGVLSDIIYQFQQWNEIGLNTDFSLIQPDTSYYFLRAIKVLIQDSLHCAHELFYKSQHLNLVELIYEKLHEIEALYTLALACKPVDKAQFYDNIFYTTDTFIDKLNQILDDYLMRLN